MPSPRTRRVLRNLMGLATIALFGGGALMLAGWLRERHDVAAGPAYEETDTGAGETAGNAGLPDPRMRLFLDDRLPWRAPRSTRVGHDQSFYASAASEEEPLVVFSRMAAALERGVKPQTVAQALADGPSATIALRMQAQIGFLGGVGFFLRMPPDLDATRKGRLRLEPGGIVLAYPGTGHWEYVAFYFPNGLDFDGFTRSLEPRGESLAPLGPSGKEHLEPLFTVQGERGGQGAVFCRAKGRADAAVMKISQRLVEAGWMEEHAENQADLCLRVLDAPGRRVWLSTEDGDRSGGLVTVILGGP